MSAQVLPPPATVIEEYVAGFLDEASRGGLDPDTTVMAAARLLCLLALATRPADATHEELTDALTLLVRGVMAGLRDHWFAGDGPLH